MQSSTPFARSRLPKPPSLPPDTPHNPPTIRHLRAFQQQPEGYTPVLNYEENRRHTHIDKVPHTEKIQYKKHLHAIISYG